MYYVDKFRDFSVNHGGTNTNHYALKKWLHPVARGPAVAIEPLS
jgi:hypothetical protein